MDPCNKKVCKIDDLLAHACIKENVDNAKAIIPSCPKGTIFIYKIDGCFSANTPILMWNSSIKIARNIVIGDCIMGDDKTERNVLSTCTGFDYLYNINQKFADPYIVNSKHTLVLYVTMNNTIKKNKDSFVCIVFNHQTYMFDREVFSFQCADKDSEKNALDESMYFLKLNKTSHQVLILVDIYMNLSDHNKATLFGIKSSLDISPIIVTKLGFGPYFGWNLDGNRKFLLKDKTIVKNCNQIWIY
jgi:hypothetical protein